MSRRLLALAAPLTILALALGAGPASAQVIFFETGEIRRVLQHGPWPQPLPRDPSNRVSGDSAAIALGQRLFFDGRLSAGGKVACASCHVPDQAWTDGRRRAVGLAPVDRNTPTVLNVVRHRWFSWDGRADSLWSQSMKPIIDPREMGASARHAAVLVRADAALACLYAKAYGRPVTAEADDERVLVNVGKALAAFVERLGTGQTAFDEFRDALARGDRDAAGGYPAAAQRGLRIFVGKGNCSLCHFGPAFTNGEFHDVGVPFLAAPGRVDGGRHEGIKRSARTATMPRERPPPRRGTSSSCTRTSDSSRRRRCGTWDSRRPTCTMGATRACVRWSATTRSWTWSASTHTASSCCARSVSPPRRPMISWRFSRR